MEVGSGFDLLTLSLALLKAMQKDLKGAVLKLRVKVYPRFNSSLGDKLTIGTKSAQGILALRAIVCVVLG